MPVPEPAVVEMDQRIRNSLKIAQNLKAALLVEEEVDDNNNQTGRWGAGVGHPREVVNSVRQAGCRQR